MDKEDKYIRDLFTKEFENYELVPEKRVWKQIRRELFKKQFTKFNPGSFNIYYLSALVFVALTTIYTLNIPKEKDKISQAELKEEAQTVIENTERNIFEERQKIQPIIQKSEEVAAKPSGRNKITPGQKSLFKDEKVIADESRSTEIITKESSEKNLQSPDFSYTANTLPNSYFSISEREGCTPLKVTFINHSENAVNYSWSFGDGGYSNDKNPSYIFDGPGTYFVNLTVTSKEGNVSGYTDSILVHPLPEVNFRIDSDVIPGSGQPVFFYNYTRDADYFEWHFGDGSTSNIKEPSHYYQEPGNYDVCLIARSVYGCSDSMIIKNAFADKLPEIFFPNAFTPNRYGPSDGRYNIQDPGNHIFHPIYDEEVHDYQLKIFNRSGILIFESNDINVGWDGYFYQELQPQGVYIWKARGRFANGRSFVKMGDVTLIWMRE